LLKRGLNDEVYDENAILGYTIPHKVGHVVDLSKTFGYTRGSVLHQHIPLSRITRIASCLLRSLPVHSCNRSVPWTYDLETETDGYGYNFKEMAIFSERLSQLTRAKQLECMVTSGMGAPLLKKIPGGGDVSEYYVDLTMMKNAEVRSGYMKYGCYITFQRDDDALALSSIRYEGITYHASDMHGIPESIYVIAMSSLVSYVTIVLHAGLCHYVYSGNINVMLNKYLREHPDDPDAENLADFIRVFCFRNAEINTSSRNILISSGGIIKRLFAFTNRGIKYMLRLTQRAETDMDQWIFHNDNSNPIEDYINSFVACTRKFIENAGASFDDDVIELLVKQITVSTVVHELVGSTIGIWVLHPRVLKTKSLISEFHLEHQCESRQSYSLNKSIIYLTSGVSVPMLLSDNLRFCFRDPLVRKVFEEYQVDLRGIKKSESSVSEHQQWVMDYFDMRNMETSISL
jgi:hypothetical protein